MSQNYHSLRQHTEGPLESRCCHLCSPQWYCKQVHVNNCQNGTGGLKRGFDCFRPKGQHVSLPRVQARKHINCNVIDSLPCLHFIVFFQLESFKACPAHIGKLK